MRPAGEVRLALLAAARDLTTSGVSAVTARELAHHAQVGERAAHQTVRNLVRVGVLLKVGERPVEYRNRPVAEYAPACADGANANAAGACEGFVDLALALAGWRG